MKERESKAAKDAFEVVIPRRYALLRIQGHGHARTRTGCLCRRKGECRLKLAETQGGIKDSWGWDQLDGWVKRAKLVAGRRASVEGLLNELKGQATWDAERNPRCQRRVTRRRDWPTPSTGSLSLLRASRRRESQSGSSWGIRPSKAELLKERTEKEKWTLVVIGTAPTLWRSSNPPGDASPCH